MCAVVMHTYTRTYVLLLCCYARMCYCGYVLLWLCTYVLMLLCCYVMHVCVAYVLLLCTHPPAAILGYTNINICQAFTFGSRKIIYIVNYFSDGLDNTYLYSCRLNMRGRVFYYLWRLVDINMLTPYVCTCMHVYTC